tara:strand:- start:2365 stop:4635 length:2271 start_codon:yes stop_codon:yes gene_type:complete
MDTQPLIPPGGDKGVQAQSSGKPSLLSKIGEFLRHPVRFIHNARLKKEYVKLNNNIQAKRAQEQGRPLSERSVTAQEGKAVLPSNTTVSENTAPAMSAGMTEVLQMVQESKIDERSGPMGSIVQQAIIDMTEEVPFREVGIDSMEFAFTSNTSRAKGTASELIGEYATDPTDAGVLKDAVQKRQAAIQKSLRDIGLLLKNPNTKDSDRVVLESLVAQLELLDGQLSAKLSYLEAFSQVDPLSKEALTYSAETFRDAALSLINDEIRDEMDLDRLKALDTIRSRIETMTDEVTQADDMLKELKLFPKKLTKLMGKGFPKKQRKGLKKRLARERITVLQKKEWNVISKEIQLTNPRTGESMAYKNTITPASKMGNIIGQRYEADGIGGVPSLDMTSSHAVNMALSQATNPEGVVITEVMRVGVLSAAEVKGTYKREQANLERGKELYTALVATNEEILSEALNNKGPVVEGLAINLETPDGFRHMQAKATGSYKHDEYRQTEEQYTVHQAMQGLQKLTVLDGTEEKEVEINFKIKMASVGVNPGAVGKASAVTGGWGKAGKINSETFDWLFKESGLGPGFKMDDGRIIDGRVGATLTSLGEKGEKRTEEETQLFNNLKEVTKQVLEIYEGKTYKKGGVDPYKLASRLVTLGNLLRRGSDGHFVVLVNCKSAKDRTNHVVNEAIHQGARADMGLEMIPPDTEYTDDQRNMFGQIALNSGGAQVQKYNTGVEGQKTKGVNLHLEGEALRTLLGGSGIVPV